MLLQGGARAIIARLKTTNSIKRCLRMQISHRPSQAHASCGGIQANKHPALVPGSPDPPTARLRQWHLSWGCSTAPSAPRSICTTQQWERHKTGQLTHHTGY